MGALPPPTLSQRIESLAAAIVPLQIQVIKETNPIDASGHWSASVVASRALERAEHELTVAYLSLRAQEK
jgi:hypothetical protein